MTYCCGILVREGLVMIADTRTNAGLDNISTFRKLHIFAAPGERIMAIASAGNLSLSQSVLSFLHEGLENPETGERETLLNAPTMFQAAQRVGRAIRKVHTTDEARRCEAADVQVRRVAPVRRPDQGRAAAALHDLLRRQLHRMHHRHALPADRRTQVRQADARPRHHLQHRPLRRAQARPRSRSTRPCAPTSASACRSTCWWCGATPATAELAYRIEPGEPYFHDLRERWSAALRAAHPAIPRPPYVNPS